MSQFAQLLSQGTLRGPAKRKAVTELVNKLTEDLKSSSLSSSQRDAALEELKVYGRDPQDADAIFTKEGVQTLTRHAFDSASSTTSHHALRVLCNAMLLKPETRQQFVDLGYERKAVKQLQNDTRDDEFLVSRIIFLATYGTTIDLVNLIDEHGLAETIAQNLSRRVSRQSSTAAESGKAKQDPMEGMALAETLKLLFNVTKFCSERLNSFAHAVPPLVSLLLKTDVPSSTKTPLDPPLGLIINAIMNFKLDNKEVRDAFFPENEPFSVADRLIQLLDLAMKAYSESEVEAAVTPLVCVISNVHEHAPTTEPSDVRQRIRSKLLPTEEDRKQVLGRGDSLPARLLRNSTNPLAPELQKAVSHLFFDMSDRDASTFVKNVGYGYASGFLFQNNIPIPEGVSDPFNSSDEGSGSKAVNPITGQFLDAETFPEMPEMTMEEKEREAERLFVLFERLKKTGIVSVQNPVEQAVQSGRFEELPDSDDEEEDDKGKGKK